MCCDSVLHAAPLHPLRSFSTGEACIGHQAGRRFRSPIPVFGKCYYTEGKPDYQCFLSESWNDRKGQFDLFSLPRHSEPVSQHRRGDPFPRENVRIPAAFIAGSSRFCTAFKRNGDSQSLPLRGEGGSPRSHARGETDEVSAPRFVQRFKRTGLHLIRPSGTFPDRQCLRRADCHANAAALARNDRIRCVNRNSISDNNKSLP